MRHSQSRIQTKKLQPSSGKKFIFDGQCFPNLSALILSNIRFYYAFVAWGFLIAHLNIQQDFISQKSFLHQKEMKKCVRVRGISTLVGSRVQKSPKPPLPAPESEDKSLYRRLSALGGTGGSVADTLNEYLSEGHFVKKYDLWSAIKQLRRFGKLNHALQVCSLPFSNFFFFNISLRPL